MKKIYTAIFLLTFAPITMIAQSVIADQQFSIQGKPLRIKTYEHGAEGYLNSISEDGIVSSENVSAANFRMLTLDPNDFYLRFWLAIDSLLGESTPSQADYAQAASLFGGIVLAVNSGDGRPVAGRLLLSPRILGSNPKLFTDKYVKKVRYYIRPSHYQNYLNERKKSDDYFRFNQSQLLTTQELLKDLQIHLEWLDQMIDGFQARKMANQDSLNIVKMSIQDFKRKEEAKLIQDTIDAHILATKYLLWKQELATPPDTKADTAIFQLMLKQGLSFPMLDGEIRTQQNIIANNASILAQSGMNLQGVGNLKRQQIFERRDKSLQGLIDDYNDDKERSIRRQDTLHEYEQSYTNELDYNFFLLEVDSVRIEFNQGMIERIVATTRHIPLNGDPDVGESMVFTNVYPIGFSTFRNYKQTIGSNFLVDSDNSRMIPLGDLIKYIPNLRLNTRDFSPADTTITFFPTMKEYVLHKDENADILKAKIFTDFVGLGDDEPNGLIQTEVEKRINLFTWRLPVGRGNFVNTSFFQYVRPIVTISKIDSKLRQAPVSVIKEPIGPSFDPQPHIRTMDLLRYESLSTGLDLNLWLLDSQPWKYTFFLNAGARFGRVGLIDSLRIYDSLGLHTTGVINDFAVNTFRFYPEAQVMFYPDERFNLGVAYRPTYIRLLSDALQQVPNTDAILAGKADQNFSNFVIHTFELSATIHLTERGDLYGRYRIHLQNNFLNTNFYQAQVGYAVQITKKVAGK